MIPTPPLALGWANEPTEATAAMSPGANDLPDPEERALEALDQADLKTALTILMEAYGSAVYRFCRQMVTDDELAEDAHQMTFVQAYESLERFSRRSSLRTWLYSIARHRCLDALKVSRRRRARFELTADPSENPDTSPGAEDRLAQRARGRALEHCLDKLAPAVRTAVLLRFHEELSYPEMARICGERPPALQVRVTRALPKLRHCLESLGYARP